MIPLIPLLRLMHLRISGSCTVFRGTGSRNDGSIHNRTAMHQQAGFLKAIPDVSKNLLSDVVFLTVDSFPMSAQWIVRPPLLIPWFHREWIGPSLMVGGGSISMEREE